MATETLIFQWYGELVIVNEVEANRYYDASARRSLLAEILLIVTLACLPPTPEVEEG
jgi:hypothetical protein